MVSVKYSQLCDHSYTVKDRATLVDIMGWEGRVTDDDPACQCIAAILIQPPRLGDSLSLPAPLPGAPCFTGFMESLSVLTISATLFYLSLLPCFSNCSSLSCLISLLSLLSLSSLHIFLLAYCHNLFLSFTVLSLSFVCLFFLSSQYFFFSAHCAFFHCDYTRNGLQNQMFESTVAGYRERHVVAVQCFGL